MTDEASPVVTEIDGPIAVVRFNRPALRNPLSLATLRQLSLITSSLLTRDDIQAIIFTGSEDIFASGANIREIANLDRDAALEFSQLGQELFQTIVEARQLTIAAINGYCMGGALDLALACDLRVASSDAILAHPGVRLGIITGWGGTQRLPQLIPRSAALELLLTGRRIHADEALRISLVASVSKNALETARLVARNYLR